MHLRLCVNCRYIIRIFDGTMIRVSDGIIFLLTRNENRAYFYSWIGRWVYENSGGGRKRENMCSLKGVGTPNEIRR